MATAWPKNTRLIGKNVARLDGPAKSSGRAKYSYDINLPGMLHAVMLRCPYAHALIESLDVSAARKTPGFKALVVLNATIANGTFVKAEGDKVTVTVRENMKNVDKAFEVKPTTVLIKAGKIAKPGDFQAGDKILIDDESALGRELYYAGEEILALCADTEEHALDALQAIKVKYKQLPHIVKEEDALKGGGVTMNPPDRANKKPTQTGKSAKFPGFEGADAVHEGSYGMPVICHQCLEPHGLVASWDKDGALTVYASTQAVWGTAGQLSNHFRARLMDLPASKIRCITHYMGGGYGSKFGPDTQGLAAAELALRAGAPVKLMLDRADEVVTAGNRPSAFGTVKIAGKKDGTITAYSCDTWGSPGIQQGATVNFNLLPYVYPFEFERKHTVLRMNTAAQRAMRAPGHPQNCFLTDCALDDLCAKLGLDPMQVRLKNLPPNLQDAIDKTPLAFNAMRHTIYTKQIQIAAELAKWKEKWHEPGKGKGDGPVKHGMGMALHTWVGQAQGNNPGNDCTVLISSDGSVTAQTSTQDLGTGQRTVTAIVVAEILGLEPGQIVLKFAESPFGRSSGSGGSTTCPSQAPAALQAVLAARDDFLAKVAKKLGVEAADLAIEPGKVTDKKNKKDYEWKKAAAMLGMDQAKGTGYWTKDISDTDLTKNDDGKEIARVSNGGVGGVQVAEVSVDTETGVVRVTKMIAVQDCGLVVDKLTCESQITGGVVMGLNYALFEERVMDRVTGRQCNPDMEFYKLGGLADMPPIVVHLMDMPERGVIGVGEPPTISTHAAIGNAVFNAIGVRVPQTPFTPDRVLAALAGAKGGKG